MTDTADHKVKPYSPSAEPVELTDQELLRTYAAAKYNYRYEGPIDDWPRNEERALTVAGLRAVIAADRAGRAAPARLRHCPTHGQQPPEAWGCPECLRELREELAAARLQQQQPVSPADHIPDPTEMVTPPAEGEVRKLAAFLEKLGSGHDDLYPPRQSITLFRAAGLLQQQAAELATLRQRVAPVPVKRPSPDPTAETAVAMMYALRDAELSGKPRAIGLANALHKMLMRHMQSVRVTNKGKHDVVPFTDIALIITFLCYNRHA